MLSTLASQHTYTRERDRQTHRHRMRETERKRERQNERGTETLLFDLVSVVLKSALLQN